MGDLIGTTLGERYRVEGRIGDGIGGQGTVYRGTDLSLRAKVAIKVLRPELAQRPGALSRFEREARSLARIRHEHVVIVRDFGTQEGICYLVEDYVPGENLKTVLRKRGALPAEAVLEVVRQVGNALAYIHRLGIVHRDIKPANIIIDSRSGHAVLVDFGIAHLMQEEPADPTLTEDTSFGRTGTLAWGPTLTPTCAAPEQWEGGLSDARTDIYAFGLVVYEMLAGRHPFNETNDTREMLRDKHLHQFPQDPRRWTPSLPAEVYSVLLRALAKRPEQRYPTAEAFVKDLELALTRPSTWRHLKRKTTATMRRLLGAVPPLRIAVGAVILVALIVLGARQVFRWPPPPPPTPTSIPTREVIATVPPSRVFVSTPTPTPTSTKPGPTRTVTATATATIAPMLTATPTMTPKPSLTATGTRKATALAPERKLPPRPELLFPRYDISRVSYARGQVYVYGRVTMPRERYPDQTWEASWAGNDVVSACGIDAKSERIKWWPVGSRNRKEGTDDLLGTIPAQDINCKIWIKLSVWTNKDKDSTYALFDLSELGVPCKVRGCQ
jgi:serine/threonine protein kinase